MLLEESLAGKYVSHQKPKRTNKWSSEDTINIGDQQKAVKAKGNKEEVKKLNAIFQCEVRKGKSPEVGHH